MSDLEGLRDRLVLGATLGHKMRRNCTDPDEQGRPFLSSLDVNGWVNQPGPVCEDQDKAALWVQPDCEPQHRRGPYSAGQCSPFPVDACWLLSCAPPAPLSHVPGYKARTDSHLLRPAGPSCPVLSKPQQQASSYFPYFRVI